MRGGKSFARKDIEGIITCWSTAEMKMFQAQDAGGVPAERGGRLPARHGLHRSIRIFAQHVATRYDAEPGFITMNMPRLLDALNSVGIENPIVCSNINKIGFRMSGGIDSYLDALNNRKVPCGGDVGIRLRHRAREAIEWVTPPQHRVHRVPGRPADANIRPPPGWSRVTGPHGRNGSSR